jgi:outer membrane protein
MRRIWILTGFLCLLVNIHAIQAQKVWTLEECISYAHDNNLQVKRQALLARAAEHDYDYARAQTLPTANVFGNYMFNKGRAPNFDDYTYVNRSFQDANIGVESRMDIFNGLNNLNSIKSSKLNLLSKLEDIENLKNDITMEIAGAYLQILLNEELLKVAIEQLDITHQQVEKNEKLVEVGNMSRGELYEIQAQEAVEKANVTKARNTLLISYLTLMQYMDLENEKLTDFKIDTSDLTIEDANPLRWIDTVYSDALRVLPLVRSAEYNLQSMEKGLNASQGLRSPSLSVRYLYYTLWSQISSDPLNPGEPYLWQDQLRDKGYQRLTFSLNIPIFNRMQTQNQISNAKVSLLDAQVNLDQTKQTLFKNIQLAYADAVAAIDDYESNTETVYSMQEAFNFSEERFNVGTVSSVDYNIAKNNLTKAQSDLAQAKYLYIFYTKILDFWAGIPISL